MKYEYKVVKRVQPQPYLELKETDKDVERRLSNYLNREAVGDWGSGWEWDGTMTDGMEDFDVFRKEIPNA